MGFIVLVLSVSAIAYMAGWLFVYLIRKQFRLKPMDSALQTIAFTLTTVGILLLPVLLHYALNGALLTWTMPNWYVLFFGLLFMVLSIAVCILGVLFAGISALISAFSAKAK